MHLLKTLMALSILLVTPSLSMAEESEQSIATTGNVERGKIVFFRCGVCHSTTSENEEKIGPSLHGVFGRQAGGLESFEGYSKALLDADFVWTKEMLDSWLRNPNGFLPGNTMAFTGVMRKSDRDDVIAYILSLEQQDN